MNLNTGYGLLLRAVLFLLLGLFFAWRASSMMPGTTSTVLWIFVVLDAGWAVFLLYAFVRSLLRPKKRQD